MSRRRREDRIEDSWPGVIIGIVGVILCLVGVAVTPFLVSLL